MAATTVDLDIDLTAAPVQPPETRDRILDAALGLVARWGVAKTSIADVAKAAGCSRATLYRAFPGKQDLFTALGAREATEYAAAIVEVIDEADDLAEALTAGLVVAARLLRDHDAVQYILANEPGLVLPFLGFHQVDRLYEAAAAAVGPHLERFLPAERAAWAAEWVARALITYVFNPTEGADLTDRGAAERLVTRYLVPAFTPDLVVA